MKIKSMPADGDCLFWALGHYYDISGPDLRKLISRYIRNHSKRVKISGASFDEWIQWSEGITADQYAERLRNGMWGGAMEMAIFNAITGSSISVWKEVSKNTLKRITRFDGDDNPHCHLVYMGGNHYGVLI